MKSRSMVALGAVMLISSIGLAFYWYEYRPSRIRAVCEMKSTEQAKEFLNEILGKKAPHGLFLQANKEAYYMNCLREHGLER